MRGLALGRPGERALRLLCLGAHSDDVEIGCGATLLGLLERYPESRVHWVVFSAAGQRADEARRGAAGILGGSPATVELHAFRDGFFPHEGGAIKERFEDLKRVIDPDLVFTHRGDDRHQDHRTVSELTWNTFRDHLVLEYEIPKYDGDLGNPNVFVPAEDRHRARKIEVLLETFGSQRNKRWFSPSTFEGLMRMRGIECAAPSGYAEGFHARKLALDIAAGATGA